MCGCGRSGIAKIHSNCNLIVYQLINHWPTFFLYSYLFLYLFILKCCCSVPCSLNHVLSKGNHVNLFLLIIIYFFFIKFQSNNNWKYGFFKDWIKKFMELKRRNTTSLLRWGCNKIVVHVPHWGCIQVDTKTFSKVMRRKFGQIHV
ncbi:unnamed protein product [Camellia sinensis]